MARLLHGSVVTIDKLRNARESLNKFVEAAAPETFAVVTEVDLQDFDFMFPALQKDPANLLAESSDTPRNLLRLGRAMMDTDPSAEGDSAIPAIFTYFGQFVDHDITLDVLSAPLPSLFDPALVPMPLGAIQATIRNTRTATLDLDSVYGPPAPRVGDKLEVNKVTNLGGAQKPLLRPAGKDDDHDLPRSPRSGNIETDRAARIGDPRNDENLIIAQLHVAFLRAHNVLIDQGKSFDEARTLLRQHYQHIVIHDFLKQIAQPQIVDNILQQGNKVYDALAEPFFMPLEFSVAAFRFGHSMVRADYDFNLNFNTSGEPGALPATLKLLFTFTALSGQLGIGQGTDTLPENWIIEWPHFVAGGSNKARAVNTILVEPLFLLPDLQGNPLSNDQARLAVRNLLRGYLLRMPTGQAVARALGQTPLTAQQLKQAAGTDEQRAALEEGGFLERTPLWYYILAEAAHSGGQRLGTVGSTLVAEVLIGLVRRSENSILRTKGWAPTLPGATAGAFTLTDLLAFARVL